MGEPKEVLELNFFGKKIVVYDFYREMSDGQERMMANSFVDLAKINNGRLVEKINYLLIGNKRKTNPHDGDQQNGTAYDDIIECYPAFLDNPNHRIKGVNNLEGTIIHESTHLLCRMDNLLTKEWQNQFNWKKHDDDVIKKPSGGMTYWEYVGDRSRLINDYAGIVMEDDICESMVAVLRNPESLDKERCEFLNKYINNNQINCVVKKKIGSDMVMPKKDILTYSVIKSMIRVSRKLI